MTDFSYQLYSSRNFPPLADTLKMLKSLGYTSVEGYGALYADEAKVAELKAHLGDSGLTMPTGHFGLDMVENDPARTLDIAKALGVETIYVPYLTPEQRPATGAAYVAFGKRLQEASKPYRDAGLGFGWHNHAFEFEHLADGSSRRSRSSRAAPTSNGRPTSPGSSRAAPIPSSGSRPSAGA